MEPTVMTKPAGTALAGERISYMGRIDWESRSQPACPTGKVEVSRHAFRLT